MAEEKNWLLREKEFNSHLLFNNLQSINLVMKATKLLMTIAINHIPHVNSRYGKAFRQMTKPTFLTLRHDETSF